MAEGEVCVSKADAGDIPPPPVPYLPHNHGGYGCPCTSILPRSIHHSYYRSAHIQYNSLSDPFFIINSFHSITTPTPSFNLTNHFLACQIYIYFLDILKNIINKLFIYY